MVGLGNGELLLSGSRVSLWDDKNILEVMVAVMLAQQWEYN